MNEKIEKLVTALEEIQPVLQYLVAENAAMAAIIRSLGTANRDNPAFQAALKVESEVRNIRQLNSTMSDEDIEAFKKSLASLLPKQLREL